MSLPKNRLTVEPATEAHEAQLAANLRPADAAEMMASHGIEPLFGIQLARRHSPGTKAILSGDRVVAMFGVAPMGAGTASVWLLASGLVKRLPVAFMRTCREEIRHLTEAWGLLVNMVWEKNKQALRWLRALGFEVLEPVPYGVAGLPFHPVRLRRNH